MNSIAYSIIMLAGIALTAFWIYKNRYCCSGCGGTLRKHVEMEGYRQCEQCGDIWGPK